MKRNTKYTVAATLLALSLLSGCASGGADTDPIQNTDPIAVEDTADGISAGVPAELPDSENTFVFTDSGVTASADSSGYEIDGTSLKLTESGVYTITGSCADGSITVKKGTVGVTLVLRDLTLSSSTGAPLSVNKESEATVFVSGEVTLTDAEDPADEASADTGTADAFDGAAVKVKAGASLTITGDGVLYLDASACKNGLKGASDSTVTVAGATVNVKAANKGISSDGDITVTGGALNIQSADDAINGDADVTVTGGVLYLDTGDDAIHADGTLTVGTEDGSGPELHITNCAEGLEAGAIYLYAGSGTIAAKDDGVNATASTLVSETAVYVYGGEWYVSSNGDALDSNGSIYLYGGTVEVYGAANNGNAALDYDGQCVYEGGTLLAVGMSGMAQAPSSGVSVSFGSSGMGGMFGGQGGSGVSIAAGSTLSIRDSAGSELYSAAAVKNANSVVFADEALAEGETYTLYIDGAAAAAATAQAGNGMGGGMMGGMGGFGGGQMPGQGGQRPNGGQLPGGMGGPGGRR